MLEASLDDDARKQADAFSTNHTYIVKIIFDKQFQFLINHTEFWRVRGKS